MSEAVVRDLGAALTLRSPVDAWQRMTGEPPELIDVAPVRPKRWQERGHGMYVFKLTGIARLETAVAAVLCSPARAAFEDQIYNGVLRQLPVSALRHFGSVPESRLPMTWQFIEYAEPGLFSPADPEHENLLAAWLGTLHASAADLIAASGLPDRGIDFFREQLRACKENLGRARLDPGYSSSSAGALLDDAESQLDRVESGWWALAAEIRAMPHTLVHGDLKAKNLSLRRAPGTTSVVAFDWEYAGWGPVAVDLGTALIGRAAHTRYLEQLQCSWPALVPADITRMLDLGRLLRAITAARWATEGIGISPPRKVIAGLAACSSELERGARS